MSTAPEKVIEILKSVNGSSMDSHEDSKIGNIELNSVAEFCRTLGEIPTYGMSGNRDEEADEMMDLERELMEERQKQELEAQNRGAWNEVDLDEKPAEISVRENEPILEEEPDISLGVAGALKLAMKKGYLDKETKKISSAPRTSQLQAQSYTIEEKFYEDDKFGKRDRYTGPVQEFREKTNYKPDVKLEYIDDSGRLLTAKEAFRYLSHKFHGKGPGKNKVDKRMKKLEQDTRLKQMSSTDTPLNTVKLLQAKQKETQSPYIVLSGGNKTLTQTMISKK
ncbi:U4/U6.U5 tri-snRNP-associated protein 1, partial [Stegodyphus mimosarum]